MKIEKEVLAAARDNLPKEALGIFDVIAAAMANATDAAAPLAFGFAMIGIMAESAQGEKARSLMMDIMAKIAPLVAMTAIASCIVATTAPPPSGDPNMN